MAVQEEGSKNTEEEGSTSNTREDNSQDIQVRPGCWRKFLRTASASVFEPLKLFTMGGSARILYEPVDPSSLAVSRILFGLLMFFDIPEERGLSEADIRWGDPYECRFPLFDFLEPLPLQWMCMVYLVMWLGSLGIAFGAYFKTSCLAFIIPYWYILLLDKTAWNNHSYLFGILAILFYVSDAHYYWSYDAYRGKVPNNTDIPAYNYMAFRFQLFLLYFYAGVKKMDRDWLSGHSMANLAKHWVFKPFKPFLSTEDIDLYIVHGFGFLLDLTVGFLIYFDATRPISFIFLILFHLMNSQMFYIGMFPFVCLITMPIFCNTAWPKALLRKFEKTRFLVDGGKRENPNCLYVRDNNEPVITRKHKFGVFWFYLYALTQLFLPYSHFITKGYNNWTNGLYGYSWDMMVHSWDTNLATVKVLNHELNDTIFIDPEAWVKNNKWQRHADMVIQYSKCLKKNLKKHEGLDDISIYVDVWVSLNGRVHQRMFDLRVDLLQADWSPFREVKWVMPLLENFTHWRTFISRTKKEVHGWSDAADAIFMADFPGFVFQNYVHSGLSNVSITALEGTISVEVQGERTFDLLPGDSKNLPSGKFHDIQTLSRTPSFFMYTFFNDSKLHEPKRNPVEFNPGLFEDFHFKIDNILTSINLVSNAFLSVLYSVPMVRRIRIPEPQAVEVA